MTSTGPLLALCLFGILQAGLGQGPTPKRLRITKTFVTHAQVSSVILPPHCDLNGNIFVRVQETGEIGSGPILKFSSDGQAVTRFELPSDFHDANRKQIRSFAIGKGGSLHMLVQADAKRSYIAHFDSDGKYRSSYPIEAAISPTYIAAFDTGDVLLSGFEDPEEPIKTNIGNPKAFTGIFNHYGQLSTRLTLKRDVSAVNIVDESAAGEKFIKPDSDYQKAIVLSTAEPGDDGTLYFVRRSAAAPIFRIMPTGEIQTKELSRPPASSYLADIKLHRNQLAAKYIKNKPGSMEIDSVIIDVYSLDNRRPSAEFYHSDSKIGAAFACYAATDDFVFLSTTPDQYFSIIHTSPE